MRAEYINTLGARWRRYPESDNRTDREYFVRSRSGGGVEYLHREVWRHHHGDIPSGHHIHHIDGNCQNNDISNLECLTPKEHMAHHPTGWDGMHEHLDRIRPLSKAWHSSPEGLEKHREIGGMAYQSFVPVDKPCEQCDQVFTPRKIGNADRFCSNKCKSAWRRASGADDIARECKYCKQQFMSNKYSKRETCGRSCANRLRHQRKKQGL